MEIKPIRTETDHKKALREIERLWSSASGTPDRDKLDVLATLVDAYESEQFPMDVTDPIDAVLFRMEQAGLERKDLEPFFKTRARTSEVLSRKRRLTLPMIRSLHEKLSIPLEVLVMDSRLQRQTPLRRRSPAR
jgi:HTH-type transcriptional regulator/antitoxin HigA